MFAYLVLLFTIIPALELYVLLNVGAVIGAGNTFLIIILTGILGAAMARWQGFIVLQNIQHQLNQGNMPSSQLLDGLMILVAGIVLLTPGFITDTFGFLLLIPWFRSLIKTIVRQRFDQMIQRGQTINIRGRSYQDDGYNDIDIN